ncbi:hypothetical protein AJ88_10135 [Mesorhizobium amorphae CCBAU 01583]|nr:hypothetical protein AJ88_10135 [Mesorhizobium amorphae CCBAU 01583]
MACFMATIRFSRFEKARSFLSSGVVTGSTMSAWRAVAVQKGSWTMIVSGRCQASTSRFRS